MCGICGIRRFGDQPLSREMFEILLIENQRRGNHATGVVIQQADGSIDTFKGAVPAWTLTGQADYQRWMAENLLPDSRTLIGHTRQATKGNPKDNKNNHPLFDGITALVHNGMLSNDDRLFKDLKLNRAAETDSDILRAILDEYGFTPKGINTLNRCEGSAAIAAVSTDYPGKLLLARSGNPIETASTENFFLWSSEVGPIIKCCRPFIKKFGIVFRKLKSDLCTLPMVNNSAWIFGDEPKNGSFLEHHQELKIATHFVPHCYDVNGTYFGMRVRFHDQRPVQVAKCRNKKCGKWVSLNPIHSRFIHRISCKACGTPLREQKA